MYRWAAICHAGRCESPHRRGDVPKLGRWEYRVLVISPQAWGCTGACRSRQSPNRNLPTGVGMYRTTWPRGRDILQSPHRRGDVPLYRQMFYSYPLISPQAWGCTGEWLRSFRTASNLPTGVGMYRTRGPRSWTLFKSPHRRGDVPENGCEVLEPLRISPQAWGCTEHAAQDRGHYSNLPTGVGMYRQRAMGSRKRSQSPHRRGDVPRAYDKVLAEVKISPQAWGCTARHCV